MNIKVQDNAPYISVIIPLYNKENEIKRAIYSVLNQSYKPYEIIVVDDESTDNSVNIVKSINDSKIKIISQKNQGEFGARNTGINTASGDYIAFLDGDDEWLPEYLEAIVSLIHEYNDAGLYCTSRVNITAKDIFVYHHTSCFKEGECGIIKSPFGSFANDHLIPMTCSSSVIPKHVFDKIGLFPTVRGGGYDIAYWCRIFLEYNIAYCAKSLVILHQEGDGRLNHVSSNMQLDEHPLVTMIKNLPEDLLNNYPYRDDVYRALEFAEIMLIGNWVNSGGRGVVIRKKISKIADKKKYCKEILYYTVLSYVPIKYRNVIQITYSKIYRLFSSKK